MTQNTPSGPAPADRYKTPQDLLNDASLSDAQKRDVLDEWEDDIRGMMVASEEGMTGPARVELTDVLAAKESLPINTPARPSDAKA